MQNKHAEQACLVNIDKFRVVPSLYTGRPGLHPLLQLHYMPGSQAGPLVFAWGPHEGYYHVF